MKDEGLVLSIHDVRSSKLNQISVLSLVPPGVDTFLSYRFIIFLATEFKAEIQ